MVDVIIVTYCLNNDNDQKFYEEFKLLEVRGHVLISWDRIPNYEKIWNIKLEFITGIIKFTVYLLEHKLKKKHECAANKSNVIEHWALGLLLSWILRYSEKLCSQYNPIKSASHTQIQSNHTQVL